MTFKGLPQPTVIPEYTTAMATRLFNSPPIEVTKITMRMSNNDLSASYRSATVMTSSQSVDKSLSHFPPSCIPACTRT